MALFTHRRDGYAWSKIPICSSPVHCTKVLVLSAEFVQKLNISHALQTSKEDAPQKQSAVNEERREKARLGEEDAEKFRTPALSIVIPAKAGIQSIWMEHT